MTVLRHDVTIDAPRDRVWALLADLEAVQLYNPLVKQARYVSDVRGGVGATRRCELKPNGHAVERVCKWQPPHAVTIELVESSWPVRDMWWRTDLIADGNRTRLSQVLEYRPKLGIVGLLLDALVMRRKLHDGVGQVLRGLKQFVEAEVSAASGPRAAAGNA